MSDTFSAHFDGGDPEVLAYAPGRAEILGNHTDYNEGYTLSANISRNVLVAARRRSDDVCRAASLNMNDGRTTSFSIGGVEELRATRAGAGEGRWTNYVRGVIWAFTDAGIPLSGFDVLLESTIPVGAGTSSSAAIEVGIAETLLAMNDVHLDRERVVELCRRAENEYVGAPCGFLDQATVCLAEDWLFLSYRPEGEAPFSWKRISADLVGREYKLIVGYDPMSAHQLTDGKYGERRATCEASIAPLQELLPDREIRALRDVSVEDFETARASLEGRLGSRRTSLVSHIIADNSRVLAAAAALEAGRVEQLGPLLTQAGHSSIYLYGLADGAPELQFVYESVREHAENWGVCGVRNMGGGFNATTLTMVQADAAEAFRHHLSEMYAARYGRPYLMLDFVPSPASGRLDFS